MEYIVHLKCQAIESLALHNDSPTEKNTKWKAAREFMLAREYE